jgi:RND family efflux transporter MFP subunit
MRNRVRLLCLALLSAWPALAAAHGDDDPAHEDPAAAIGQGAPTRRVAVLTSKLYEAVIEPHGDHVAIWLDRYDTNEPVTGARVQVSIDGVIESSVAREEEPGIYEVYVPEAAIGGALAVTLVIAGAAGEDRLGGTLDAPVEGDEHEHGLLEARWPWLGLGAAVLAACGFLLLRRRRTTAALCMAMVACGLVAMPDAFAHEDHADETPVAAPGAHRPARAPDGSLYLPKPTQRILAVRTMIASDGPAPVSVKLVGEVRGDPGASVVLQTLQGGRVAAGPSGWPELGARVRRGQALLSLTPSGSAAERAGASAEAARTEADLAQARLELERLEGLPGVVARAEVEAARARVASLSAQRAAWRKSADAGEAITAPIDGVIAAIAVRPGEVVAPGVDLLQIVNPARLAVEALAFSRFDRAAVRRASITLRDGRTLAAELAGVGAAQTGGALPVRLRLTEAAPGLLVGEPVTVWLEQSVATNGILLPASAMVRLANGETVVFEKRAAEVFVPRTVRMRPVSGERVAIVAGLEAGARVVVQGAGLLAQLR